MNELICGARLFDVEGSVEINDRVINLPFGAEGGFIGIDGNHWRIRTVSLHAFSDDSDTLIIYRKQRAVGQLHCRGVTQVTVSSIVAENNFFFKGLEFVTFECTII